MGKTFLLVLAVVVFGGVACGDASLVAWWQFEDSALDSAGSNHGTRTGGVFSEGYTGQALVLNGRGEYVDFGKDDSLAFGVDDSFSIALWMKRNVAVQEGEQDIISKCSTSTRGWRLGLAQWGASMKFYFGVGGEQQFFTYGDFVNDTNWHQVVAVLNRDDNTISVYTDGSLSSTKSIPAGLNINHLSANVFVGRRNATEAFYYNGAVDEVRVFNRALTASEVGDIAGTTPPPAQALNVTSTPINGAGISGSHPGITSYLLEAEAGEEINLTAPARVRDSVFRYWIDHQENMQLSSTLSLTMPAGVATLTAVYTQDIFPPVITASVPKKNIQVPINTLIRMTVSDLGSGVDLDSVRISLDGDAGGLIYDGSNETADRVYESALGIMRRNGNIGTYTFQFEPSKIFCRQQVVVIDAEASDTAGNAASTSFTFTLADRAFGANVAANGANGVAQDNPATAVDAEGNIWVAWQQRPAKGGVFAIFAASKEPQSKAFANAGPVAEGDLNHTNPSIAIGDRIFVAYTVGSNIFVSASDDGTEWDAPLLIAGQEPLTDAGRGKVSLATHNSEDVWLVYESGGTIGLAMYDSGTGNWVPVASNLGTGLNPDVAVDGGGNVYIVYTEVLADGAVLRGIKRMADGTTTVDSLGAGSVDEPQAAIASDDGKLHLAWAKDIDGTPQVVYAVVDKVDFPNKLLSRTISDDTRASKSCHPSIAVTGNAGAPPSYAGNGPKVFIAWQCSRNVLKDNGDTDIYFTETGFAGGASNGFGTNILVNDDTGTASQSQPQVGVDARGLPFAVWVDARNGRSNIYFAGATCIGTSLKNPVNASEGGSLVVGLAGAPENPPPDGNGSVYLFIQPNSMSSDTTISISDLVNPPAPPPGAFGVPYEFGPSGMTFNPAATVTIYFHPSEAASYNRYRVYWYDTETGVWRNDGISNIRYEEINDTWHAITFDTTHFSTFHLAGRSRSRSSSDSSCGSTAWQALVGVLLAWCALRITRRFQHKVSDMARVPVR